MPRPGVAVTDVRVALLSGGRDKPYALGLTSAITLLGVHVDFIGSDEFNTPELIHNPRVRFLNLRGEQERASVVRKASRVARYYVRLVRYAKGRGPRVFHILWNNHFELFDRTALMMYYRCTGKRLVFTAHNVNAGRRDGKDSWLNRLSLRIQYALCDHIFVHTPRMKEELIGEFGVAAPKISTIPFGINNTVPSTSLTPREAKRRLGLTAANRTLLFFGNIAPYKGLDCLLDAFAALSDKTDEYRLIIAGLPKKGAESYCQNSLATLDRRHLRSKVISRIQFVPDEEIELYFKAADVLVLPYTEIFQSGVLFLGYNFGLPAIVSNVGSLKDDVVEGETGMVFRAADADDLERVIDEYFGSGLFAHLEQRRMRIREAANLRYSWNRAAEETANVYGKLARAR
jgi:D-inositol-3-phosphate glycosyltransferase